MKPIRIREEEWYPVYAAYADELLFNSPNAQLSDEEYAEYKSISDKFQEWQEKLEKLLGDN